MDGSARPGAGSCGAPSLPPPLPVHLLGTSQACEGQNRHQLTGILVGRRGKEGRLAKFLVHSHEGSLCQHIICQQQM